MTEERTRHRHGALAMVLAASTLALVAAGASPARADGQFGCACVHNNINVPVKYRYRWGGGDWHNVQVDTRHMRWVCWNYGSGKHVSPSLQFQLDVDLTGGTKWTTYNIERLQSRAQDCHVIPRHGHYDINFRPGTNNRELHIVRRN